MDESPDRARHWDAAYRARGAEGVSWYQPSPTLSLELIAALGIPPEASVLDVGGGASVLADRLLEQGFVDVTLLDVSETALLEVRRRLGAPALELIHADVLDWTPSRRYDLWHDRAAFHFLVDGKDRRRYLDRLHDTVRPGGAVVVGTFASDAPATCSGLPVARYSASELADLLGTRFELVEARREEHTTPRGTLQPFTWIAGRIAVAAELRAAGGVSSARPTGGELRR